MIAHHLPADMDVANFRGICKNANHAIDGDNFSFWRFRFRQKFAIVVGTTNAQLMEKYKRRTKYLRRGASIPFIRGHTTLEAKMLKVVRDLIIGESSAKNGLPWLIKIRVFPGTSAH